MEKRVNSHVGSVMVTKATSQNKRPGTMLKRNQVHRATCASTDELSPTLYVTSFVNDEDITEEAYLICELAVDGTAEGPWLRNEVEVIDKRIGSFIRAERGSGMSMAEDLPKMRL